MCAATFVCSVLCPQPAVQIVIFSVAVRELVPGDPVRHQYRKNI